MVKYRLLAFVLALLIPTASIVCVDGTGDGTVWDGTSSDTAWYGDGSATEFTISTAAELKAFANLVTNEKITFEGKSIKLANDIDLNNNEWIPIGGAVSAASGTDSDRDALKTSSFCGSFNGNGHVIKNMKVSMANQNSSAGGFFNTLYGSVSNFGIENSTIVLGGRYWYCLAGGLAAVVAHSGIVDSCFVRGITLKCNTSPVQFGGFVGMISAGASISNCYATEIIHDQSDLLVDGNISGVKLGGFAAQLSWSLRSVGRYDNTNNYTGSVKLTNCYTADVTFTMNDAAEKYSGYFLSDGVTTTVPCTFTKVYSTNVSSAEMDGVSKVEESRLKEMASDFGEKFAQDTENINNGYPVLAWQGDPLYVDFAVKMHFSVSHDTSGAELSEYRTGDVYYTGRIRNDDALEKSYRIVAVVFSDDGKLTDAAIKDVTLEQGESEDVSLKVTVTEKYGEVKGYQWDENNSPLSKTEILSNKLYDPLFDGSIINMQPKIYSAADCVEEAKEFDTDAAKYSALIKNSIYNNDSSDFGGTIDSIFYDGIDYQGNPTRVFAYVAKPAGASKDNKVPAIVLVHGGGGTAVADWARLWAEKGYAAIAIDTEGRVPNGGSRSFHPWKSINNTSYNDVTDNVETRHNMWFYQAASAAILGGNVLRSYDWVDGDRMGITGSSYGSLVTLTAIGCDTRFKFAIPVYGSGHLWEGQTYFANLMNTELKKTWDPSNFYTKAKDTPILWMVSNQDVNFGLDSTSKSLDDVFARGNIRIIDNFNHSDGYAQLNVYGQPNLSNFQQSVKGDFVYKEGFDFAQWAIGKENYSGLAKISQPEVKDGKVSATVTIPSDAVVTGVSLYYVESEYASLYGPGDNQTSSKWYGPGYYSQNSELKKGGWPKTAGTVSEDAVIADISETAKDGYLDITYTKDGSDYEYHVSSVLVKLENN